MLDEEKKSVPITELEYIIYIYIWVSAVFFYKSTSGHNMATRIGYDSVLSAWIRIFLPTGSQPNYAPRERNPVNEQARSVFMSGRRHRFIGETYII